MISTSPYKQKANEKVGWQIYIINQQKERKCLHFKKDLGISTLLDLHNLIYIIYNQSYPYNIGLPLIMKDYLCIFTIINKNIIHSKYFADRVSDWLQPPG